MHFLPDFFEPPPLSPDLEWMLQSNQVSDADLAVQLTQDYANRIYFLALFLLKDEALASRAVADTLRRIVRLRAQFWGQIPLRAWIYSVALGMIRRQETLFWRMRQWLDRRRVVGQPSDLMQALRLALFRLESDQLLAVALVHGHDLPEAEAASVMSVSEDFLNELLSQAGLNLPQHTSEELTYAARLAEAMVVKADPQPGSSSVDVQPESTRFQRRLLSWVLPDLRRQENQGRFRRLTTEGALIGLVILAVILVGWSSLRAEDLDLEQQEPTVTKKAEVVVQTKVITATPSLKVLAQAGSRWTAVPEITATPMPRFAMMDLSEAIANADVLETSKVTWEKSGPILLAVLLNYQMLPVKAERLTSLLSPNPLDATIFPYEVKDYIINQTQLRYLYRFGGDIEIIRRMVETRVPVLLQKTYTGSDVAGWAAEYALVIGFKDYERQMQMLTVRAGLVQTELVSYDDFMLQWLPFGNAYHVIFPEGRLEQVKDILGDQYFEYENYETAIDLLGSGWKSDRVLRFWSSLAVATIRTYQQQYSEAVMMYEEAFFHYERIPEDQRPWRMLWYNSRPYWAYFYANDYERVISLASRTLESGGDRGLEESLYWRAMARQALGNYEGALGDLQQAINVHPEFGPAQFLLATIQGISP